MFRQCARCAGIDLPDYRMGCNDYGFLQTPEYRGRLVIFLNGRNVTNVTVRAYAGLKGWVLMNSSRLGTMGSCDTCGVRRPVLVEKGSVWVTMRDQSEPPLPIPGTPAITELLQVRLFMARNGLD